MGRERSAAHDPSTASAGEHVDTPPLPSNSADLPGIGVVASDLDARRQEIPRHPGAHEPETDHGDGAFAFHAVIVDWRM